MRAVAYLRVSTDEQTASGLGMDAQRHACMTWANREGCELAGPFADDAVSGAAPIDKRPALIDALAELDRGDVLIVAKRDRLGRDPIVVAMIESAAARKGCRVVSAAGEGTDNDDPGSVLMRRMIDAFSEYERLIIRSRTRAALASKRRRGERTGHTPYGMALVDDGRRSKKGNLPVALVVDQAEAAVIAEVKALSAAGWSLRKIAAELTARGVPTKRGGVAWGPVSVLNLIRRPD